MAVCSRTLECAQASVGGGSVKALMVDSVSAVLSSMLGGKQNEGICLQYCTILYHNTLPHASDVRVLLLCIRYVPADASCWGDEDDRQRIQHCCAGIHLSNSCYKKNLDILGNFLK